MLDFEVKRCTRRCAASGRDLNPGETVYSTLIPEGGDVRRLDYSAEEWQGPPEGIISWWRFEVPSPQAGKIQWAPTDVIRKYFKALVDREQDQDKRYILALLMVRRRMMRLEETETDDQGNERLVLYCPKDEQEYYAPIVQPTPERVRVIQDELADLLFGGGGAIVNELAQVDGPQLEEDERAEEAGEQSDEPTDEVATEHISDPEETSP